VSRFFVENGRRLLLVFVVDVETDFLPPRDFVLAV
jgi:hypothetical protein